LEKQSEGDLLALQLNEKLSFGQHRVWKRMAVKWAGAGPGSRCLDICCGSGDLAFLLADAAGRSGKVGPVFLPTTISQNLEDHGHL